MTRSQSIPTQQEARNENRQSVVRDAVTGLAFSLGIGLAVSITMILFVMMIAY